MIRDMHHLFRALIHYLTGDFTCESGKCTILIVREDSETNDDKLTVCIIYSSDCWNRPITGVAGRVVHLLERYTTDYNKTFR